MCIHLIFSGVLEDSRLLHNGKPSFEDFRKQKWEVWPFSLLQNSLSIQVTVVVKTNFRTSRLAILASRSQVYQGSTLTKPWKTSNSFFLNPSPFSTFCFLSTLEVSKLLFTRDRLRFRTCRQVFILTGFSDGIFGQQFFWRRCQRFCGDLLSLCTTVFTRILFAERRQDQRPEIQELSFFLGSCYSNVHISHEVLM